MRLTLNTLIITLVSLLVLTACDRSRLPEVEPGARVTDAGLEELERGARGLRLTGDLDAMLERGYIRILVPYSKTFFFYEGAKPRGLVYEFIGTFPKTLQFLAIVRIALQC